MRRLFISISALTAAAFLGSVQIVEAVRPERSVEARGRRVLEGLSARACEESQRLPHLGEKDATYGALLSRTALQSACENMMDAPEYGLELPRATEKAAVIADGELIARQRVMGGYGIAVDLVAYSSSGLVVGGILCYPDDGQPHPAVIHLHGGLGGIFENPDGNMLETCVNWALLHHRTAFAPSYRGQDGGEGSLEVCLGEADDVAAGATMLRSLEMTDPGRVAVVGASIGGCVALRAAAQIPDLRAVVAYVPPADWKSLINYHRTSFAPGTETTCDGASVPWDIGGPALADVLDNAICGHPVCSDSEYAARSTIPGVFVQTAPTLIVSAQADNLVPLEQHLLYSILREQLGNPVDVYVVGLCDAPAAPGISFDVHISVTESYHMLSTATTHSGLLFLLDALDR